MSGFTTDELRSMATDIVAIDPALARALLTAIKRAVRGQRVNASTLRLLSLAAELDLALVDRAADQEAQRRPRRRKPKAKPAAS